MSKSALSTRQIVIGDATLTQSKSVSHDTVVSAIKNVQSAKSGTLTTRTDNTSGTLTMASGHGILTGDKVDIYWDGGSRHNVTVGSVSTNSVPISSGAGDNLPLASTAVKVCVTLQSDCIVTGDNVSIFGFYCENRARVTFFDASNAILISLEINDGMVYSWDSNDAETTNPFATMDIAYAKVSHSGTSAADVKFAFGLSDA